jgi:hypothetical protein
VIGDRWGVSDGETLRSYPCDDLVASPTLRSPRELAALAEPRVGEHFTTAGGRELGRIVAVEPGQQLTATIMGAFMSYVLVPSGDDSTRLLLKVVMRTSRWIAPALSVADLFMAWRQLLNLKQLAER